jgi:hypothetical protein
MIRNKIAQIFLSLGFLALASSAIGLFCLLLFAQSGPTLTPAKTEARDDDAAALRALIEASPKLQSHKQIS